MELVHLLGTLVRPVTYGASWLRDRRNPARQQAGRLLKAFEAHGIARLQLGHLLPQHLQLKSFELSTADELKRCLTPAHIDWAASFLALNRNWFTTPLTSPHSTLRSYKQPQLFHEWLEARGQCENQHFPLMMHFVSSTDEPLSAERRGSFVVLLEEHVEIDNERTLTRYYQLTEGANAEHYPCLIHLLQLFTLANHHRVICRRSVVGEHLLSRFENGKCLAPHLLRQRKRSRLLADQELWPHFGTNTWLEMLRRDTDESLKQNGLTKVVTKLHRDRIRFARANSTTLYVTN